MLFRVGVSLDAVNQGMNRVSVLGEFTQPNNSKPGAGLGLEWALSNLGNSGFSLAARGSYTIQPDNNINDFNLGTLTTQEKSSSFTGDGVAVGGGIGWSHANTRVGFDYAWKNMGLLGGTNFLSFSFGW